jgi:uncharacterized protein YfaP (DUF2135 family)
MAVRLGARSKFQQPFDPITAILFKMIQALTFFFVLAVLFMNPEAKKGIVDPKAEYIITTTWEDENPDDIDLWVEDPKGNIIWFRNREAGLVHLDRDDRGMLNDTIETAGETVTNPLNQEVVTIRGVVPGEYVVNLHYYATETGQPVKAAVRLDKVNPSLKVIDYTKLTLEKKGDEQTALRFTLDADGEVTDVNRTHKAIVITR